VWVLRLDVASFTAITGYARLPLPDTVFNQRLRRYYQ
jgi:hypothetical protein